MARMYKGTRFLADTGNIVKRQVNMIVCPGNLPLSLHKGVCGAIKKEGGEDIGKELEQHKKKLKLGSVVLVAAGHLPCNTIAYVLGPQPTSKPLTDQKKEDAQKLIAQVVQRCMEEAVNNGYNSIAIPAIGTGEAKIPHAESTKTIVSTICKYLDEKGDTGITEIHLVDCNKDKVTGFTDALNALLGTPVDLVQEEPIEGAAGGNVVVPAPVIHDDGGAAAANGVDMDVPPVNDVPIDVPDAELAVEGIPEAVPAIPEAKAAVPEAELAVPEPEPVAPEPDPADPKAEVAVPEAKLPVPEAELPVPDAVLPVPEAEPPRVVPDPEPVFEVIPVALDTPEAKVASSLLQHSWLKYVGVPEKPVSKVDRIRNQRLESDYNDRREELVRQGGDVYEVYQWRHLKADVSLNDLAEQGLQCDGVGVKLFANPSLAVKESRCYLGADPIQLILVKTLSAHAHVQSYWPSELFPRNEEKLGGVNDENKNGCEWRVVYNASHMFPAYVVTLG